MRSLIHRRVPAADGVQLATDVYLPEGPGPFPTVLQRTPYHRRGLQGPARAFVERGYAYVVQDCRGKYDSDGVFTPLVHEAEDGVATLDWVAEQSWCNGRVGMWGRSYHGIVQVPAAASGHEALKCIAPSVAPGSYFRDWIRYDGCFALGNAIRWSLSHGSCRNQPPYGHFSWDDLNTADGIDAIAARAGFETPCLRDWAAHDTYDDYWRALDWDHKYDHITVPGLHAGGWFDHLTRTQYESFRGIRARGATGAARADQKLLIGPWGHQTMSNRGAAHTRYGDWDFGPEADLSVLAAELQFLDYHLKDLDNGYSALPAVRVFLMGDNRWVGVDDWPPREATVEAWHLDSDGSANLARGDGRLTREAPGTEADDAYTYDPADPVPTRGGALYWGLTERGPVDVRDTLLRPDVLCYRSQALPAPRTVLGDIALELHITSDAEDTDFIARLCVEEPSGAVTCLTQGQLRCRYRDSWSDPTPLSANTPTCLRLNMGQTAYTFPAGSRVVLLVTSSDFPRILPHRNRLAPLWEGDAVPARNRVLHGPSAPSRLLLPVLEADV